MAQVRIVITADATKAKAAARAIGSALNKQMNDTTTTYKTNWGKANQAVLGQIKEIGAALGITAGVGLAIREIISLTRDWNDGMIKLGETSAKAGRSLTAFSLLQEKGTRQQRRKQAVRVGIGFGFEPGVALSGVQALQSQLGSFDKAIPAFESAARLSQFEDVPQQSAIETISMLMGLGVPADRAARMLLAGGKASSLKPEQISEAASVGLIGWNAREGGPEAGLAAMATLSIQQKKPSKLGTLTAAAKRAVFGAKHEKFFQKILKKTGQSDDLEGRIQALASEGITGELEFEKAGFADVRGKRALDILIKNRATIGRNLLFIRKLSADKGLIARERREAEEEEPILKGTREIENAKAKLVASMQQPTDPRAVARAAEAREKTLENIMFKTAMSNVGLAHLVPEGDERVGFFARRKAFGLGGLSDIPRGKSKKFMKPNLQVEIERLQEERRTAQEAFIQEGSTPENRGAALEGMKAMLDMFAPKIDEVIELMKKDVARGVRVQQVLDSIDSSGKENPNLAPESTTGEDR